MSAIPWKFPRTGIAAVDRILSEIADRLRRRFSEVDTDLATKSATTHAHTGTYQPLDAGLTSIAGLTTASDKMIYTTASDTYSTTDLTSLARTILDDATDVDVRTTISAQESSSRLTDIAGLSMAAGDMIYWNGTNFVKIDSTGASNGDVLKWNDTTSTPYWSVP